MALLPAAPSVAIAGDAVLGALVGARLIDVAPLASVLGWGPERAAHIPVPVPISVAAAALMLIMVAALRASWWPTSAHTCANLFDVLRGDG